MVASKGLKLGECELTALFFFLFVYFPSLLLLVDEGMTQ